MKVLSIFPYPILPLTHGGRVRAYHLAVGLARAGAEVDLCCPWHPRLPLRSFEREGITIRPYIFAANALPAVLGDRVIPPLLQLSWQPYTIGPRRLLRRTSRYDVVEFHFCAHPAWMSRVRGAARIVYMAHNVERDFVAAQPGLARGHAAQRVARLEHRAVRAADLVVTCTAADAARLAELYGSPKAAAVISNGFDEHDVRRADDGERGKLRAELGLAPEELAVLFVGGRAAHNRQAVRFLEEELLPRISRPARLLVVGECAPPRRDGRVLALGHVDELRPLLAAADVAVNPVESGSGSNVKLAEYLAAGLPVVTTPVGLRGYEDFAHLTTVAELGRFPEAVSHMARPRGLAQEVGELSWSALGRRLHGLYTDLLSRT
ncbi:MAG TPA: glycosyltransferase family 4 protein [Gemmatimonadales bacterium]|nr:glycosyltransferase family 4 protein [Gemmatimonadales bacterium]